jgi:hypothetical protein
VSGDADGSLAAALEGAEVSAATADRATVLVDDLERIIRAIGGFMTPADQDVLRAARAFLVERGRRPGEEWKPWQNR